MKKLLLICLSVLLLTACNNSSPEPDPTKEAEESLLATDRDFSDMVQRYGLAKAMAKYYDDAVVVIPKDQHEGIGKVAILKQIAASDKPDLNTFSWTSEKAVVSSSGDLGYIWGHYTVKVKTATGTDTTLTAPYCTIYKRTKVGSWKAVMDQNKITPMP